MTCTPSPGATHHVGCACHEARWEERWEERLAAERANADRLAERLALFVSARTPKREGRGVQCPACWAYAPTLDALLHTARTCPWVADRDALAAHRERRGKETT